MLILKQIMGMTSQILSYPLLFDLHRFSVWYVPKTLSMGKYLYLRILDLKKMGWFCLVVASPQTAESLW